MNAELIAAYASTVYTTSEPFVEIRIGEKNAALDDLLRQHNKKDWAFITAWNPFSQQLSDAENEQRHQQLLQQCSDYKCFEGEGIGEDPSWAPEKSLLILGIDKQSAAQLGTVLEQNAIVIGRLGGQAELLLLK